MHFSSFVLAAAAIAPAFGELSGRVGPLTSHATKSAKKTCNVLDYGAKADKQTDIGPPLLAAFNACKSGGTVVIPTGDFAMATWVTFESGSAWALQLDGTIYRTGDQGGNMLFVRNANDFEMFSSTGKGAVQGNGFMQHKDGNRDGARILRVELTTNFSVHDVILVDAPMFHFVINTCTNGEAYNMAIRGADWGGLDGVDVSCNNCWIHDIMVTNKDECVTTKTPSKNLLIENIYCNVSGGCAMGSLGTDTAISSITYRNIYTWNSNNMMMIKSNGGGGYVENVVFENFIGHSNAYSVDMDQTWESMKPLPGDGVKLQNITFNNWKGTVADGTERGPVKVNCAQNVPCTEITINDIAMWTETGDKQIYSCGNGYGQGTCLKELPDSIQEAGSNVGGYAATTSTQTAAPTGYSAPSMADNIMDPTAFGTVSSIPIPTMPLSFFPDTTPISKPIANGGTGVASPTEPATSSPAKSSSTAIMSVTKKTAKATSVSVPTKAASVSPDAGVWDHHKTTVTSIPTLTTTTKAAAQPTTSDSSSGSAPAKLYYQCGGLGWTGPTKCEAPAVCVKSNDYYSQCIVNSS